MTMVLFWPRPALMASAPTVREHHDTYRETVEGTAPMNGGSLPGLKAHGIRPDPVHRDIHCCGHPVGVGP